MIRIPHNKQGEKWCGGCKVYHPLAEFHRCSTAWDGRTGWCIKHALRRNKETRVRRTYGLEPAEYEKLMAKPCAICGEAAQDLDHCHVSGKVRAALCRPCNLALGLFQDDTARLNAAVKYLEGHR